MKFLSPEVVLYLYRSIIPPCMEYCYTSGLMPIVATWNCQISSKNGYVGLLVLHLLPLLNPWLLVKMYPAQVFSIGIALADNHLNWLNWFQFLLLKGGLLVILRDYMIFLSPFLDVTRISSLSQTLKFFAYRMLS